MAYVANDATRRLLTTSSTDGTTWTPGALVAGQSSKTPPSIGENPGWGLVIGYVSNNPKNDLLWTSQQGQGWSGSNLVPQQSSSRAPALAAFRGQLIVAYVSNNPAQHLLTTALRTTIDGAVTRHDWTPSRRVGGQSSKASPALTVFNNQLVMAYVSNNDANRLLVTSSSDGITWTPSRQVGGQTSTASPSLIAVADGGTSTRNKMLLAYVNADSANSLFVTSSSDGVNWSVKSPVSGQSASGAPSMIFRFVGRI